MGNKKGRTAYPENFKTLVIEAHQNGESYESIARRFKISAYSAKYEPLELCKDTGDKYSWVSGTWPWEEQ